MPTKNIFYSWQSDSDDGTNRYFIEDCLKRAIRKLSREDLSEYVIDRDTKKVPGMPDIGNSILEKIKGSNVVVADLTIINPENIRRPDERPVSNPNVLFELGFAFGKLGHQSMIGVFNTASGKIEDLPFDLRPKRLMVYHLPQSAEKSKPREALVESLVGAIKLCLGESEDERSTRASKIYGILTELWFIGTEIDNWHGVKTLPATMKSMNDVVSPLPELMAMNSFSEDAIGRANYIAHSISRATTLHLNDENWDEIKGLIRSAKNTIMFITNFNQFKIDAAYHDELVNQVRDTPSKIDDHIAKMGDEFDIKPIQAISIELRKSAFHKLLPQHPKFQQGLDEISLDLRLQILKWSKKSPQQEEEKEALSGIRERLQSLIGKYANKE